MTKLEKQLCENEGQVNDSDDIKTIVNKNLKESIDEMAT